VPLVLQWMSKMLRINIKHQDTLLEGETYLEIFERLHDYSFLPEDDLKTIVEMYLKKVQKLLNKNVNTSFSHYENAANELIRVGVFEKIPA
jgi:hypothetical protein